MVYDPVVGEAIENYSEPADPRLKAAADRIALEQHAVARDRLHRERAATRWGQLSPLKGSTERR